MPVTTHTALVDRAARWLRSQGCSTVVTRKSAGMGFEEPDAIGWKGFGWSLLVECKAGRADFLRDRKKPHRVHPSLGVGTRRVYFAPPGVIQPHELPPSWGLVEVSGQRCKVVVQPRDQPEKNRHAELCILLAHCRRLEGVRKPYPGEPQPCP